MKIIKNEEIVLRQVGEFYFLIDPKLSYNSEVENLFQTDEIGACIWNCIESEDTENGVFIKVLNLFVDEKTDDFKNQVAADVRDFLLVLRKQCFISEVL